MAGSKKILLLRAAREARKRCQLALCANFQHFVTSRKALNAPVDIILLLRAAEKRLQLVILRGAQNDNNLKLRAMREAYVKCRFALIAKQQHFVILRRAQNSKNMYVCAAWSSSPLTGCAK